jgi:hypothetical protein
VRRVYAGHPPRSRIAEMVADELSVPPTVMMTPAIMKPIMMMVMTMSVYYEREV